MLNKIFKLLPLFIVEIIARRNCEVITVNGKSWHVAYNDVLVKGE